MAFHTVLSASIQGLRVEMVHVEADVSNGLPMFHMVGYLSAEVKEASERVKNSNPKRGHPDTSQEGGSESGPGYGKKEGGFL